MLECVVNISEGEDLDTIAAIASAAGPDLIDLHSDAHHNRSVLTLVGEEAPRRVAAATVGRLDLTSHRGAHPRTGVVDVVPFVPLSGATMAEAVAARDSFAAWASRELGVPCFLYGTERTLPDIRRGAFADLLPDQGAGEPHPTAGAMAVGARPVLIAYNVWLAQPDLGLASAVARQIRGPHLRTLGLQVGDRVQVSMNLISPEVVDPAAATDAVAVHAAVDGCELVGLLPRAVLEGIAHDRWAELDLAEDRTIEARLARREAMAQADQGRTD